MVQIQEDPPLGGSSWPPKNPTTRWILDFSTANEAQGYVLYEYEEIALFSFPLKRFSAKTSQKLTLNRSQREANMDRKLDYCLYVF